MDDLPDFKPWQWYTLIGLLVAMNIVVIGGLILVITTYDLWAGPAYVAEEPTVPAWATPTATRRPTFTPTLTPQVWPTPTPSRTPTRMPPPTPTWTPLPTRTPTITPTPWPTDTPTPYRPPTDTPTPTPTRTRVPTRTPMPTLTPIQTPTTPRSTANAEPSPAQTPTPSPSSTSRPTRTPLPTLTATFTPSPALSPTAGPWQMAAHLDPADVTFPGQNRISLTWKPTTDATAYRVYSDMGTGYGVYVLLHETDENTLTNFNARPGRSYHYRVGAVTPQNEVTVAQAVALTTGRAPSVARTVSKSDPPAEPNPVAVQVTPAPTPLPPDTIILGLLSAADYTDDVDGSITIVGEVRNDSQLNVGQTTVTATFYGTDGQIITEASGQAMLQKLPPGVRAPFTITLTRPENVANYSLRATALPLHVDSAAPALTVVNSRHYEDTTGFYHVAGIVENTGNQRAEQARIIVTLYDRGGHVVNVGFAYPQPNSLPPGAQADFDVVFTYYPKVFSHVAVAVED